jgi:CRISPR/Cas system-associated protein endoribonuclease Cas2
LAFLDIANIHWTFDTGLVSFFVQNKYKIYNFFAGWLIAEDIVVLKFKVYVRICEKARISRLHFDEGTVV